MVSWPPKRETLPSGTTEENTLGLEEPQEQGCILEEITHTDGGDEHRQDGGSRRGL